MGSITRERESKRGHRLLDFLSYLKQEGQIKHDVLVSGGGALGGLPAHLPVDLRVGDPVQLEPLLVVLEDDLAEGGPVQLASLGVEERGPKLGPDGAPGRPTRGHDPAGHHVGVDDRHAQGGEHLAHGALPRGHAPRQTYQEHPCSWDTKRKKISLQFLPRDNLVHPEKQITKSVKIEVYFLLNAIRPKKTTMGVEEI